MENLGKLEVVKYDKYMYASRVLLSIKWHKNHLALLWHFCNSGTIYRLTCLVTRNTVATDEPVCVSEMSNCPRTGSSRLRLVGSKILQKGPQIYIHYYTRKQPNNNKKRKYKCWKFVLKIKWVYFRCLLCIHLAHVLFTWLKFLNINSTTWRMIILYSENLTFSIIMSWSGRVSILLWLADRVTENVPMDISAAFAAFDNKRSWLNWNNTNSKCLPIVTFTHSQTQIYTLNS